MRKLFSFILLGLLCSIGTTWAETIFSANPTAAWSVPASSNLEITNSYADITGGSMYVINEQESAKDLIKNQEELAFQETNNNTYFKIVLSQALQAGDEMSVHMQSRTDAELGLWFSTASTRPAEEPTTKIVLPTAATQAWTSNLSYSVVADDGICGETTIYIYRHTGKSTYFNNLVISRGVAAVCPSGITISGTQSYTEGQTISLAAALTAGNGTITYQWYKGGTAEANKLAGKTAVTLTIDNCVLGDAGNYYCIASKADCGDAISSAYAITVNEAPQGITAVSDHMWNFSDWDDATISSTTIIDNLEVKASSEKTIVIDGNNKSIDGYSFTKRIKLGGTGSVSERNVHFKVSGNCIITVYGMSSSKNAERTIDINIGGVVVAQLTNDGNAIDKVTYTYFGGETDVYVYSDNSGNNIYGIKVEPFALHAEDVDFYGLFMPAEAVIPSGITAYTGVLNPAETELTLTQVSGTVIPANTPVLVKANAAGTYAFAPSNTGADGIASSLKGVAVETTVASIEAANTGKKCLTLGENSGVVAFRQPAGTSIAANKVYLLVTATAQQAPIRIVENTTNIENVEANEAVVKFIENGKLYIKKNGVTYNVVGAVVK